MSFLAAFKAVLIELWDFVCRRTTPLRLPAPPIVSPATTPDMPPKPRALAFGATGVIVCDTWLLERPVFSFDGGVCRLYFPQRVQILAREGMFTQIRTGERIGWVETAALTTLLEQVLPIFEPGTVYGVHHPETIKLRRLIADECLGGVLCLPLQSLEFIVWRLREVVPQLMWPTERPRLPGTWQRLWRGNRSVHIGVEPRTASVLEYTTETGQGIVAFVAEVHPDASIVLHTVGSTVEGQYQVITVPPACWREWRPVFISFL